VAKLITSTLAITTRDAENGVTIILSGGRGGVPVQSPSSSFFCDYTVQLRHSRRTHTRPYERTHTQTLSL